MISVAIVEDEKNYNNTLKRVLDIYEEFVCVGQLYSGAEALVNLPKAKPDVVLMDLQLQDYMGSDVICRLKDTMPKTSFVVITSFEDDEKILEALRVGAIGYLIKGESLENIIKAIKDAYDGGVPMSSTIAHKVLRFIREQSDKNVYLPTLSKTEKLVLELLSQGKQYKEIAHSKQVSIETIKKQVGNIYRKLGVNNKIEAINFLRK